MMLRGLSAYLRCSEVVAVLVVALCTTAPAAAEQCKANQINGRWALYSADGTSSWIQCFLSVRQKRQFSGACIRYEFGEPKRTTVSGILKVNRACALNGQFLDGVEVEVEVIGTLQAGGQAGAGILFDFVGDGVHFSLVRKP